MLPRTLPRLKAKAMASGSEQSTIKAISHLWPIARSLFMSRRGQLSAAHVAS
jgi:hypothetical protein